MDRSLDPSLETPVPFVTGSADGTIRTWNLTHDGEPAFTLDARGVAVAVSPDSRSLAVSSANGTIRLLEPESLRERGRHGGLGDRVNGLAFSPDGRLFAATDDLGILHRWRLPDAVALEPLKVHNRRAFDVAFSPDGGTLATSGEDRVARLLDPETGDDRVPPLKHPARVFCTAFHPQRHHVATACEDRHVRVWNIDESFSWLSPG